MKRTSLCYIRQKDEYLMLYRNKKKEDPNAGKWIGVGGKLEEGESPEACLLREVYEETGFTLTDYFFHGVIHFQSDSFEPEDMYLYTGLAFTGKQKLCEEGSLVWVNRDKILDLELWEGDRFFLERILSGLERFEMELRYEGERLVSVREV